MPLEDPPMTPDEDVTAWPLLLPLLLLELPPVPGGHRPRVERDALIQGPVSGTSLVNTAAAITFIGNLNGDQFGSGMTAGDVDGDGARDVIISANREGVADNGAVYVFLNPASGTLYAFDADTRIVGTGAGDYLGSWLDFAEDTNRSGTDMIIVGASGRGQTTSEKDKGAVEFDDKLFWQHGQ